MNSVSLNLDEASSTLNSIESASKLIVEDARELAAKYNNAMKDSGASVLDDANDIMVSCLRQIESCNNSLKKLAKACREVMEREHAIANRGIRLR